MIQPETWKAVRDSAGVIWSAVGPLIGVWVGAYVANRNQRRQWLLDNKRQEYRELLTALMNGILDSGVLGTDPPRPLHNFAQVAASSSAANPEDVLRPDPAAAEKTLEFRERLFNAIQETGRVFVNRIFIAEELKSSGVHQQFIEAFQALDKDGDVLKFALRTHHLQERIIQLAAKSFQ
jgi:hypothetical protein